MLLIDCPFCGPRAQVEFHFGGEAALVRAQPAGAVTDATWTEYLFFRANPRGDHYERWCHRAGCGLWFNVMRDTVSHRIARTAAIDVPAEAVR